MLKLFVQPKIQNRLHQIAMAFIAASFFALAAKQDVYTDYAQHAHFAELLSRKMESPPHFIYHLLVILVESITSLSFLNSGFVVVGLSIFFSFFILMFYLQTGHNNTYKAPLILFCLALFFVHPIPLFFWFDNHLYYGYMAPNTFHNPTSILLKPLALFHFMVLTRLLFRPTISLTHILFLGTLTAISILAKPSYMMSLLPAVLFLWIILKSQNPIHTKSSNLLIALSLIIPTALLIGWQFIQTFGSLGTEVTRWNQGKIAFSPLELFRYYSSTLSFIPKVLGSLAFPLSVVFFHFKTATRSFDFQLAFANMVMATIFNYCFLEKGSCFFCGDFGWSSQIALFLLNCVSLKIYFQSIDFKTAAFLNIKSKLAVAIPMAVFTLHVVSGLFWYASNLIPGQFRP
ncbi:MAG: hypothetical protein ACKN9V_02475 [Pseudomonadota bacterium]